MDHVCRRMAGRKQGVSRHGRTCRRRHP
jgi:hypothetical protein